MTVAEDQLARYVVLLALVGSMHQPRQLISGQITHKLRSNQRYDFSPTMDKCTWLMRYEGVDLWFWSQTLASLVSPFLKCRWIQIKNRYGFKRLLSCHIGNHNVGKCHQNIPREQRDDEEPVLEAGQALSFPLAVSSVSFVLRIYAPTVRGAPRSFGLIVVTSAVPNQDTPLPEKERKIN